MAVAWGRAHVDLTGIRAIGIDEIHWQYGPRFLTLVYQIDSTRKRLLWIGQHRRRRAKTLLGSFRWFGKERDLERPRDQEMARMISAQRGERTPEFSGIAL